METNVAYRIVPLNDTAFGVEVIVPDVSPTMVTSFPTEDAAERWIAGHKERLLAPPQRGRFRRR
jgi:hypothetical protein